MFKTYNFSAGPAMLPKTVMRKAQKEFLNWKNTGFSVIEISHRSKNFYNTIKNAEKILRKLLKISEKYAVLFCHGGARGQFSTIPMSFIHNNYEKADYINSGYWSKSAFLEAKKYCNANKINVKQLKKNKKIIIPMKKWKLNNESKYVHYCPNETIEGISIYEEPNFFSKKIIIGDFSSTLLSRVININKYSLIYAGAQKNIGPSGITLIILKKNLIKNINNKIVPSILNYNTLLENESLFNTPTTFSWYLSGLVFKWLKKIGGLKKIQKINSKKSNLLYNTIDKSDFYFNNVGKKNRSKMNIVFNTPNEKLDNLFIQESEKKGLFFLKNHYLIGGLRASIYNSMPFKGVKKLVKFMIFFEKIYG
ncbi:3-phosphoserine/phosphohydroxythreonine transaminase [Buchnera aphidicola]|uniref:3-phosphoserine/phosphohydroxythreonine transaminase n=1 Tax=Buchnera aphidicola TaxID=9 RepID=UPI003464A262